MAGISPTQRTLKYLRQEGYLAGIVERYVSIPGTFSKRIDLFNFIDIIAIKENEIWAIQSCGQTGFAAHDRTILTNDRAPLWLKAGGRIKLIAWRKLKVERGKKRMKWEARIKEYSLGDFDESEEI